MSTKFTPTSICLLAVFACAIPTFADNDAPKTGQKEEGKSTDQPPVLAHIEAHMYQVMIAPEQAETISTSQLSNSASTPEQFRKELEKLGSTRVIGGFDQDVVLAPKSRIQFGASVPVPTGSSVLKGQRSTQVTYQDYGCILTFESVTNSSDKEVTTAIIEVECSTSAQSNIQIAPESFAPIFNTYVSITPIVVDAPSPTIMLAIKGAEATDKCTAQIARIQIHHISPSAENDDAPQGK